MTPAGHRSFVLAADNHFTSLALEQQAWLRRRYRRGPDIEAAMLLAVSVLAPPTVLEVGGGAGALASMIHRHIGVQTMAVDSNATLVADAHARGVGAVVADVRALPFADASLGCVVADRTLRRRSDVDRGLTEIRRVLRADGALVVVARSNTCDGHELDVLTGYDARPRTDALSAANGWDLLSRHFHRVDQQTLDYTLEFPDGQAAARYVATLPGRAAQVPRIAGVDRPIRLSYGARLFVAEAPRRPVSRA